MNEFDLKAREWDNSPLRIDRAKKIAEAIGNAVDLSKINSAFEYGCGTGLLSFALRPHIKKITLADSSAGMIEVVNEKISASDIDNMSVLKTDLISENIPEEKFDLIYTLMTLHHIDDIPLLLGKFNSMLNDRGLLLIADLDKEDGSFHGAGFMGHKGFDRGELSSVIAAAGFGELVFSTPYIIEREEGGVKRNFTVFLCSASKL